jgi:hypothetical protein
MPQQIAVAFALCAFAVSIGVGLLGDLPAMTVLVRSLVVLMVAGATGRVLGQMALVALNEHLTASTVDNPIPEPVRLSRPRGSAAPVAVEILEDVESP